jgi:hypothetical protein
MESMESILPRRVMKNLTIALSMFAYCLFLASIGSAALSLPRHVFQLDDIDVASEEANAWGQPIAFVYTDLDCGCSLAESASYDAFRELRSDMTIVYACSKNEWSALPDIVKKALNARDSGQYIPKTVIVDAKITRVLAIVPYIRDPAKRILALEETIETAAEND